MEEQKKESKTDYLKKRLNEIDNKIDSEKQKMKKIDDIQEEVNALNKNLNKCIELLSISIKGSQTSRKLNEMSNGNKSFYANFSSILDNEKGSSVKKINKLNDEKDNLIKETKKQKE